MDNELEGRTESRRIPGTHNAHNEEGKVVNGSVDEDAHILSNLIQSLDASGGESGPVVNILKEMEKTGWAKQYTYQMGGVGWLVMSFALHNPTC